MSVLSPAVREGPARLAWPAPAVHVLGNGRSTLWLSEAGGGRSSWCGAALSRWSAERLEDADGWHLWVRDRDSGRVWPVMRPSSSRSGGHGTVSVVPGQLSWAQRDHGIETRLDACVAPDADVELRVVTLVNHSDRRRTLELSGCLELVLQHPGADASHPAFSKLFVQTARDTGSGALVATRRPRASDERHPAVAHLLAGEGDFDFETDRARFLGRGHGWGRPAALTHDRPLACGVGNVLDPVFATRRRLELSPGESRRLTFVLAAAERPEAAIDAARTFESVTAVERAFVGSATAAREALERLVPDPGDRDALPRLTGALLYGDPGLRAPDDVLRRAGSDASARRALGLAGGQPVVVVALDAPGATGAWDRWAGLVGWWRSHGIEAALVGVGAPLPAPPGPGVLAGHPLGATERDALLAGARIVGEGRAPEAFRAPAAGPPEPAEPPAPRAAARRRSPRLAREALRFDNGHGGFSADGREYVLRLDALRHGGHRLPPLPWVNVIANPRFGTLVSETGAGFSWSGNSREHRLTPWSNDPLLDPHGESLHVLDEDTGLAWSPQPGPTPHAAGYETRHGLGASVFRLEAESLRHETVVAVDRERPVRLARVRLTNLGDSPRRLVVVSHARLVLGADDGAARRVVTARHEPGGALFARQPAGPDPGGAVAFSSVVAPAGAHLACTTDRAAFLGRHGRLARPRALRTASAFDGAVGPMHDPCFAWRVAFELAPGATAEVTFLLGEGADGQEATRLVHEFATPAAVDESIRAAVEDWHERVSRVRITTPWPELDLLVNAWLPYQTLSCRLWGRSAFYQSGGAFGFRDQLQDALSLLALDPERARAQVLLHAGHQFVEGDVLHWWHPPRDRGMRTRFADDLLWLPYLAAQYVAATGDHAVLDETAPFLTARPLADGEQEAFLEARPSGESGSVYEHAARAIDRSLRTGSHGLPLFGCGDWNDGMNRVGHGGRGESVWMGWFLVAMLDDWAARAEARGEQARAGRWHAHRLALLEAIEREAWDGDWYRRGWYDDGTPLGSRDSDECRIDALVQAWSVLSGGAPRERAERAMESLERHLVSESEGLLRLLTPAFQDTPHDPGYIKGYVAGVRENGGQYTHAALWAVRAFAELGRRDLAARLLRMLSPVRHTADPEGVRRYQVEPYVIAADVYGVAPHVGRGGWTWYTGSSGWMYRVALESILGVRLEDGRTVVVHPCIPDEWPDASLEWRVPGGEGDTLTIAIRNPQRCAGSVVAASLDGRPVAVGADGVRAELPRDGGAHVLEVVLGPRP